MINSSLELEVEGKVEMQHAWKVGSMVKLESHMATGAKTRRHGNVPWLETGPNLDT